MEYSIKCLGLLKLFFTAMTFFSYNVLSVSSLKCVSMNNKKCKARPEIININSNEHLQNYVLLMLLKA